MREFKLAYMADCSVQTKFKLCDIFMLNLYRQLVSIWVCVWNWIDL